MSNNLNKINHLGIIMDGNRRWAKSNFLPAMAGHKAGSDNLKKITELADIKGIKYLTVWGLSTDNLKKRDGEEVKGLIKIIDNAPKLLKEMIEKGIKINIIGNILTLPEKSQKILSDLELKTKNNTGLILTLALVYGGQDEIVRATKKIINAGINPDTLTKEVFKKYLDTALLPNPDVIVRPGGDIRHSGFLLFDSEYSEYYFTDKKWPEFDEVELDNVIAFYNKSNRNFGK